MFCLCKQSRLPRVWPRVLGHNSPIPAVVTASVLSVCLWTNTDELFLFRELATYLPVASSHKSPALCFVVPAEPGLGGLTHPQLYISYGLCDTAPSPQTLPSSFFPELCLQGAAKAPGLTTGSPFPFLFAFA